MLVRISKGKRNEKQRVHKEGVYMSRRYRKRTGLGFIVLMVLCICGIVTYKRIELNRDVAKAQVKIEKLETERINEEKRTVEIKNEEAYRQTIKYIIDVARTKLGLVFKDEILFEKTE